MGATTVMAGAAAVAIAIAGANGGGKGEELTKMREFLYSSPGAVEYTTVVIFAILVYKWLGLGYWVEGLISFIFYAFCSLITGICLLMTLKLLYAILFIS